MVFLSHGLPRMVLTNERYRCPWFSVHEEKWDAVSGTDQYAFYRIDNSDGVLMLARTTRKEIILVRQFRQAIQQTTIEFPAGSIENGESPHEACARELQEETGYCAGKILLLGSGHLMMNRCSAREYLFLAEDCAMCIPAQNNRELDVLLVSSGELKDLVLSGCFTQIPALSLISLAEWKLGMPLGMVDGHSCP